MTRSYQNVPASGMPGMSETCPFNGRADAANDRMKDPANNGSSAQPVKKRIVILGGGFGGVYAALRLERLLARETDVEICLVSRDNFFLFTPLLHELAASALEITNIVNHLRKLLHRAR